MVRGAAGDAVSGGKTRVAVLFGGRSAEHEVSVESARNVVDALDETKYDVLLVAVDRDGRWLLGDSARAMLGSPDGGPGARPRSGERVAVVPGEDSRELVGTSDPALRETVDVAFPVLHGPFGEDGTVQGLLELAGIPYVGAGVLGSAVGMDKDVMKRLLHEEGVPTADWEVIPRARRGRAAYGRLAGELGVPFFVKPANLGSSVGVSKVDTEEEFRAAVDRAFRFDTKLVVEEAVEGREIECSVLGNDEPAASLPGEIVPRREFYSYEAKYLDEEGAELLVPAELPDDVVEEVRGLALRAFETLCCAGMARVDFFLEPGGRAIVNEINTLPGFTRISMYPKLWEVSGVSYPELVDRLVELALERHRTRTGLRTER